MVLADPYTEEYARSYAQRWSCNPAFHSELQHNLSTLREMLRPGTTWLDAGCGTGYFLSQHPTVHRAGFDRSAAMLEQARAANPEGVELRLLDLRQLASDWVGQWTLVTATGQPWTYLATMDEVSQAVSNLAAYTACDGTLVFSFYDLTDFTPHQLRQYFSEKEIPDRQFYVNGVVWSYREDQYLHQHMLLPSSDQWIRWLSKHFRAIEIRSWNVPGLRIPRRVFLCSRKRQPGDRSHTVLRMEPTESWMDRPLSYFVERVAPLRLLARLFRRSRQVHQRVISI